MTAYACNNSLINIALCAENIIHQMFRYCGVQYNVTYAAAAIHPFFRIVPGGVGAGIKKPGSK